MGGEIFNIGGGAENSLSLLELFDLLSHLLEIPAMVYEKIPRRLSDQDCFIASIAKAQHMLGWAPQVTCETGVSRMLEWCEKTLSA
jgi:CDP-paratose 2-epimerase